MVEPLVMNQKLIPLQIYKKQILAENIVRFDLIIPDHFQELFQYDAGQYLTVAASDNGPTNDYSITGVPRPDHVTIIMKARHAGGLSAEIISTKNDGDLLFVSPPKGRFTLQYKPAEFRTILLFAGGIGITPIFSHLYALLHKEPRTRIFLFYANHQPETIVLEDELRALQQQFPERLHLHFFFSQSGFVNALYHGRITGGKVALLINQVLSLDDTDPESTIWDSVDHVLICGPEAMIREIAVACYQEGIPKANIHFELFGTVAESIYPPEPMEVLLSNVRVDVQHQGSLQQVTVPDNRNNILQSLLDLGIAVPYSCKAGICGSCICILEQGTVAQEENEYLTDQEASEGLILPCVARATSDHLLLNFDQ